MKTGAGKGDGPLFADLAAKIGPVAVNGYDGRGCGQSKGAVASAPGKDL